LLTDLPSPVGASRAYAVLLSLAHALARAQVLGLTLTYPQINAGTFPSAPDMMWGYPRLPLLPLPSAQALMQKKIQRQPCSLLHMASSAGKIEWVPALCSVQWKQGHGCHWHPCFLLPVQVKEQQRQLEQALQEKRDMMAEAARMNQEYTLLSKRVKCVRTL